MKTNEYIYDWNQAPGAAPALKRVAIDDETLRDGLQSPSVKQPEIKLKRRCLRHMVDIGIQRVNVGLPMSSQQADIRALTETIWKNENLPLAPGLAIRTVLGDFGKRWRSCATSSRPLDLRANAFSVCRRCACGRRSGRGTTCSIALKDAGLGARARNPRDVRDRGHDAERAGGHPDLYTMAVNAGVREVCIADTAGHTMPWGTTQTRSFYARGAQGRGRA